MLFQHRCYVHVFSTVLLTLWFTHFAISHLRFCSDYDYRLFFPNLGPGVFRYVKMVPSQSISEYTICLWAKHTEFPIKDSIYTSYVTSSERSGLDHILISYESVLQSFKYAWRTEDSRFRNILIPASLALNSWHHLCFERRLYPDSITFYINGSFHALHENVGINQVHPGGGVLMLGEEQDLLEGGFVSKQSFFGEMAHYNMWNYTLGSTVISKLHSEIGGTENGNLISWPDIKSFDFVGDVRILRSSPFFKLFAFNCSWSNWRCNSDFCVDADLICENKPMELRIESCYHYYMCQFPTCPTPTLLPCNATAHNTSSTSVFVQWGYDETELFYRAVRGYILIAREQENSSIIAMNTTLSTSLTSITLQNLKKFTSYIIQIAALSSKDGPFVNVTVRTAEGMPSRSPVNLTTVERYSRFVYINWGYVPEGFLHGILRAYKIRYYQTSLGNWTAKTVDITAQSSSRRNSSVSVMEIRRDVEIGDLIPYTNYSFQLTAFTVGDGVWTDWLSYTTEEEVPKSPPLNITVQNTSSTSLLINWSPVPVHLRDGFIRGYWMTYQRDDLANGNATRLLIDPWLTSFEIQNLRKYTMYNVKMTAFTIKGESNESDIVTCSTDEDVPGLPPSQLHFLATGLASLSISWGPIPPDFHHGIILGYELRYNTPDGLQFVFNFTINETTVDIADLNDYSLYPISVSAFTRKGLGPWSDVTALTDTPSPYQPPVKLSAISRSHISALNVTWTRVNLTEMFGLFEIKSIQIYYQEISTGFVKAEDERENPTVCYDVEVGHCLIPGLKAFTLYRLRATWINKYGLGPFSKAIEAETCRCHERFTTNWYNLPPYVSLKYKDGNIEQKGIMATVLQDAITYCCLECSTQNSSILDLRRNGLNESADASTEEQMRARIGQETDISFPVYGQKNQDRYGGVFAYTPVVESPGVAIIVSSTPSFSVAGEVTNKIYGCWPLLLLMLVLAALTGVIMWVMETNQNPEHFPTSTMSGIGNGFWWAYITMTTVGYGDRAPVTIQGRIVAVAWTLVGLVITGIVVGALTASLNEIVEIAVSSSSTVYGSKVGAIANTSEYRLAMRMNAKMDEKVQYTTLEELYKDLLAGELAAIFLDVYRMGDFKEYLGNSKVRLGKVIDNEMAYGVVWNGRSQALTKCLSQYTKSRQAKISTKVENTTSVAELKTDDSRLELVLSVFDPESKIFVTTLRCSFILLGIFVLFGLIWECIRRRKLKNKVGVLGKPTNLIEPEDLAMFQSLFTTFHIEIKSKARKILRRHIKELDVFWKTEQGTSRSTLS